jgi:hypothetical protein
MWYALRPCPRSDMRNADTRRLCSQMVANAGISMMKSFVESPFLHLNQLARIWLTFFYPQSSYCGGPRPYRWCQPSRHVPLLQVRRFANDCARPWRTHHRFARPFSDLIRITHCVSGTFSHRRVLWHGQKGTGISERLLCKQIRYPSVDSVRWCVGSPFFPGSGAVRMLKRFAFKSSFGIRRARHYRQRLRSWTCQDPNVYASPTSLSSKDVFLNLIRG